MSSDAFITQSCNNMLNKLPKQVTCDELLKTSAQMNYSIVSSLLA